MDFIQLDVGSEWAAWVTPYVFLAEGNLAEAHRAAKNIGKAATYRRDLLAACTANPHPADLAKTVRENQNSVMTEPDAQLWYHMGALLAACGQNEASLQLLTAAVQQNYCAYLALLDNPLLKDLRKETMFNQVLTAANNCQWRSKRITDEAPASSHRRCLFRMQSLVTSILYGLCPRSPKK